MIGSDLLKDPLGLGTGEGGRGGEYSPFYCRFILLFLEKGPRGQLSESLMNNQANGIWQILA